MASLAERVFAEWRRVGVRFEGSQAGAIVTDKDEWVADSFDAFLGRYLTEPELLKRK